MLQGVGLDLGSENYISSFPEPKGCFASVLFFYLLFGSWNNNKNIPFVVFLTVDCSMSQRTAVTDQAVTFHPEPMFSHAGLVCSLSDSASWPFLSSKLPGGLHRPVLLLKLCAQGLGMAAAVSQGNFTALPKGTPVVSAGLLVAHGFLDSSDWCFVFSLQMERQVV